MKLTEIFGKTLYYNNGWDEETELVIIDTISANAGYYVFTGIGFWGDEDHITVPADNVDELITSGKTILTDVIGSRRITKEWIIK